MFVRRGLWRLIIIPFSALMVLSCSSALSVSSTRLVELPVESPLTPSASVVIVDDLPATGYTSLGEITIRWQGIRQEKRITGDPAIQNALRSEAAKLGADAVTQLQLINEPAGRRPGRIMDEPPRTVGLRALAVRLHPGTGSGS